MRLWHTGDWSSEGVFYLSFSPDGRTLASACASATVKLWHVPTWRQLMSVQADAEAVQFSPDGSYLAAVVIRSRSDVFRGDGAGLRILKAPALAEIDAEIEVHRGSTKVLVDLLPGDAEGEKAAARAVHDEHHRASVELRAAEAESVAEEPLAPPRRRDVPHGNSHDQKRADGSQNP